MSSGDEGLAGGSNKEKHQTSNSRLQRSFKPQHPRLNDRSITDAVGERMIGVCSLALEVSLELGVWNLEFSLLVA
jgi:hypothetical protein